jgi:hypothetical protein
VPARDKYRYFETEEGIPYASPAEPPNAECDFSYKANVRWQYWVTPDGAGRYLTRPLSPADTFLTPTDRAMWVKSGEQLTGLEQDSRVPAGHAWPPGGLPGQGLGPGLQWSQLDLPAQPAALEQAIARRFNHGSLDPASMFFDVGALLPVETSPAVRAALYRVIERLPDVELLGPVTDRLGRRGTGIGFTGSDGFQDQMIFNPATSAVLEERQILVSPGIIQEWGNFCHKFPVGTVWSYTVYVTSGVTSSDTVTPQGTVVPYLSAPRTG